MDIDHTFPRFLESLLADGRLRVEPFVPMSNDEQDAGVELLSRLEPQLALELPGESPGFDPTAAAWAAVRMLRACQLAVYRELPPEAVVEELDLATSFAKNPSVHYSVDLTFRFLPELIRFAASAAEADPLVERLRELAAAWPLSSVGVAEIEAESIDSFAESATLMRVYADRIIAAGDRSRLSDPRAREAVEAALGEHTTLAPKIARELSLMKAPTE